MRVNETQRAGFGYRFSFHETGKGKKKSSNAIENYVRPSMSSTSKEAKKLKRGRQETTTKR